MPNLLKAKTIPIVHQAEGISETPEDKQKRLEEVLKATNAEIRRLINRLRDSIPVTAEEFWCSNVGDTSGTVAPYSFNIIEVSSIVINTPSASTSVILTLGNRVMPLPAGLITLSPIHFQLHNTDKRNLTVAPSVETPFWYWIMGRQLPEVML